MRDEEKALIISDAVQEWLEINDLQECKPEDIMSYLQEKGIYNNNRQSAKQLRSDLRKLVERKQEYLVKGLYFEQRNINRFWYFKRVID